jgi:hypothetical protein
MLNYEIDPTPLRPLTPSGVELDSWEGRMYVSMVGFQFLRTRLLGLPIPFHSNFPEINLRFYVRRKSEEGWRRGVVFIREVVPRWMIAYVARRYYNERYVACPMRSELTLPNESSGDSGEVVYGWSSDGRENTIRASFMGEPFPSADESEEQFITEHYWGYAAQLDGTTLEYRVEHPPWRVWQASDSAFECDVGGFYGEEFMGPLSQEPSSVFVAEGSAIVVNRPVRIAR